VAKDSPTVTIVPLSIDWANDGTRPTVTVLTQHAHLFRYVSIASDGIGQYGSAPIESTPIFPK